MLPVLPPCLASYLDPKHQAALEAKGYSFRFGRATNGGQLDALEKAHNLRLPDGYRDFLCSVGAIELRSPSLRFARNLRVYGFGDAALTVGPPREFDRFGERVSCLVVLELGMERVVDLGVVDSSGKVWRVEGENFTATSFARLLERAVGDFEQANRDETPLRDRLDRLLTSLDGDPDYSITRGHAALPADIAALEARLGQGLDPAYREFLQNFGALRVSRRAADAGDAEAHDGFTILGVGEAALGALEHDAVLAEHRSWSGANLPVQAFPVLVLGGPENHSLLGDFFVHLPDGSVARPYRGRVGREFIATSFTDAVEKILTDFARRRVERSSPKATAIEPAGSDAGGSHGRLLRALLKAASADLPPAPRESPLFELARAADFDGIDALLAAGADIHEFQQDGSTVLHHAVMAGDCRRVEFLLRRGANPNIPTSGLTALATAFAACDDLSRELVEKLLAAGADPDLGKVSARQLAGRYDERYGTQFTPLLGPPKCQE